MHKETRMDYTPPALPDYLRLIDIVAASYHLDAAEVRRERAARNVKAVTVTE